MDLLRPEMESWPTGQGRASPANASRTSHSRTEEGAPDPTTSSLARCTPKSSPSWSPRWGGGGQPGATTVGHGGNTESVLEGAEAGWTAEAKGRAA